MSVKRVEWFLGQGVNNLHIFAIEKKAQRRRECSISNTNLSHTCLQCPKPFTILACLTFNTLNLLNQSLETQNTAESWLFTFMFSLLIGRGPA
jgi:hypothetical protein